MNTRIVLGAALLLGTATWAAADDGSTDAGNVCTAPGFTVLTDASGDVNAGGLLPVSLPVSAYDLLSLQVLLDDSGTAPMLTFTFKTGALSTLPPNGAWYTSFKAPDAKFYGVRMATDISGAVTFESYTLGASTGGIADGRFPDVITPADASSNYSEDGTITIVVPASQIGVPKLGTSLTQFNAGAVLVGGAEGENVAAEVLDGMPDDLTRRGEAALAPCAADAAKSGSIVPKFGGALGAGLLLPLLGLAGLRRRPG